MSLVHSDNETKKFQGGECCTVCLRIKAALETAEVKSDPTKGVNSTQQTRDTTTET